MQHGNLLNGIMSNGQNLVPEVGMGATHLMWSDRQAYTIIEVKSPTRLVVQRDTATRTDNNGMSDSQGYEYTPNPDGVIRTITLRKNGRWYQVGDTIKGTPFAIGYRKEYYDYSF